MQQVGIFNMFVLPGLAPMASSEERLCMAVALPSTTLPARLSVCCLDKLIHVADHGSK